MQSNYENASERGRENQKMDVKEGYKGRCDDDMTLVINDEMNPIRTKIHWLNGFVQ